ncbi:uncharacterized protein F5891DRAFT_1181933 [Suillus fuscotomentosus]|uniref:Uncharacterized protein n=1 Tax=Suillus fuscotomentosus TaxID=1912939 RepID=A0AAD4EHV5_9AGAM|nr:uncharacterized protein F5891DRAFT_1181933 [Suillus fuscotomentosus]KAG1906520.1 hypothetical protein F5891DRAFT_1181933 [Suillus fuscotomentosus]
MVMVMASVIQLGRRIHMHLSAAGALLTQGSAGPVSEELPSPQPLHTPAGVAMIDPALSTPSLVQEIYGYLPLLTDILAWRSSSRFTRSIGQSIAAQRFTRIIHPFVGNHAAELRYLMYTWGAVITGSCALQMLTGGDDAPNNLNIVCPSGSFDVLQGFILDSLSYRRVDAVTRSNYAFRAVVRAFAKYQRGPLRITLCEAISDDIFDIITSSPTTGDMLIMTPGSVVAFYPEWTLNGVAVLNHVVTSHIPGKNVGCIENDQYIVWESTTFLQQPCRDFCPALWRNIADSKGCTLVLEWDKRYPIRPAMARSNTAWRIAEHCANPLCPYNPLTNARLARLPPFLPVSDQLTAREQEARLLDHYPSYVKCYTGMLYASAASTPLLVPVPLRDGVTQLKHINELEVLHWVDCLGDNRFNADMARTRKTFNVIANTSSPACGYGYTFFREHPALYPPPNALIWDITSDLMSHNNVIGNVLVVKHAAGDKHNVIDLTLQDIETINSVIRRTIDNMEFWM